MGTEILKSFGNLQSELEQAKSSLKGVDENIKRLIGRDPSELTTRPGLKRGSQNEDRPRNRNARTRTAQHDNEEPPNKRRNVLSVFKRLSDRPVHQEDDPGPQKQMISKVIATPKEVPSRQEALAAQSKDEKSKERNRRMFGALLGTLQKFQQEETKLKPKEEKRAQLEKKIEEHEIKEKQEIKKERQELFLNRRKKQAEIKMIELKMVRMKEYAAWEERQRPRGNFIMTKAKPHIQYLPRKMNDASRTLLEQSKQEIEALIEKKKNAVSEELKHIEERMKRNFEGKNVKENKEGTEEQENLDEAKNNDNTDQFENDGDILMPEVKQESEEVTAKEDVNVTEETNGKIEEHEEKHLREEDKSESNSNTIDNNPIEESTKDETLETDGNGID